MPDFMLCNSKLTFQMTMTPEKTNYLTQGADGQKRLKQGPDLGSYRGLSVIHSRAFSLEKGQHPRDILRRRVRTAEYYRIMPHKDNWKREFELYNEARDTYFSMTFDDLLSYSHLSNDSSPFSSTTSSAPAWNPRSMLSLGTAYDSEAIDGKVRAMTQDMITAFGHPLELLYRRKKKEKHCFETQDSVSGSSVRWLIGSFMFNLECKCDFPKLGFISAVEEAINTNSPPGVSVHLSQMLIAEPRQNHFIIDNFLQQLTSENAQLIYPMDSEEHVYDQHSASHWWFAISYYLEVYRRTGVMMNNVTITADIDSVIKGLGKTRFTEQNALYECLTSASLNTSPVCDYSSFYLSMSAKGSINHKLHLMGQSMTNACIEKLCDSSEAVFIARSFFITQELLRMFILPEDQENFPKTRISELYSKISGDERKTFHEIMIKSLREIKQGRSRCSLTCEINQLLVPFLKNLLMKSGADDLFSADNALRAAMAGISSFPMEFTSVGHWLHPDNPYIDGEMKDRIKEISQTDENFGHLSGSFLQGIIDSGLEMSQLGPSSLGCYNPEIPASVKKDVGEVEWRRFFQTLEKRLVEDPIKNADCFKEDAWQNIPPDVDSDSVKAFFLCAKKEEVYYHKSFVIPRMFDSGYKKSITLDLNSLASEEDASSSVKKKTSASSGGGTGPRTPRRERLPSPDRGSAHGDRREDERRVDMRIKKQEELAASFEFVIIRPNIEHNMLGIILGLGGSELGQTLWGQTELSCYDDSMHGIWGMSYKYHERAIVFNEKNLIRLWDVAYDGYNGGKDDTYVDWTQENGRNGFNTFRDQTMNLGESYRGPSMMVMSFKHSPNSSGHITGLQRNWPSPIVFHDTGAHGESMPIDLENLHITDVDEFRVFNKDIYENRYRKYKELMPHFQELHKMRKTAGQSTAENETQANSLAFQGSMRVKEGGKLLQEIHGSGHHGPDYVGVASVRAGKGIKYTGMAPVLSHAV